MRQPAPLELQLQLGHLELRHALDRQLSVHLSRPLLLAELGERVAGLTGHCGGLLGLVVLLASLTIRRLLVLWIAVWRHGVLVVVELFRLSLVIRLAAGSFLVVGAHAGPQRRLESGRSAPARHG